MMIVPKHRGPVASWWFEDRRQLVYPDRRSVLHQLLEMCQTAAEVLEEHRLLLPESVTFSGWLRHDGERGTLTRVDQPDVTIEIPDDTGARGHVQSCEAAHDRMQESGPFLYPIDVNIDGRGWILDANGEEHEVAQLVWLLGKTLDAHIVDVRTQSDVWLPLSLTGEPQPELARLNAPRLEAALRTVQQRLGVEPVVDDHSDYAVIDGFRLNNHLDVDGDFVQTYQPSS